jgi:hypothetical protein
MFPEVTRNRIGSQRNAVNADFPNPFANSQPAVGSKRIVRPRAARSSFGTVRDGMRADYEHFKPHRRHRYRAHVIDEGVSGSGPSLKLVPLATARIE